MAFIDTNRLRRYLLFSERASELPGQKLPSVPHEMRRVNQPTAIAAIQATSVHFASNHIDSVSNESNKLQFTLMEGYVAWQLLLCVNAPANHSAMYWCRQISNSWSQRFNPFNITALFSQFGEDLGMKLTCTYAIACDVQRITSWVSDSPTLKPSLWN